MRPMKEFLKDSHALSGLPVLWALKERLCSPKIARFSTPGRISRGKQKLLARTGVTYMPVELNTPRDVLPPSTPLQHGSEQLLCFMQEPALPRVLHQHRHRWYCQGTPSDVTRLGIQAMFSCTFLARGKIQAQRDAPLINAWLQMVILTSLIVR